MGEYVDKDRHVGELENGLISANGAKTTGGRILLHRAGDFRPALNVGSPGQPTSSFSLQGAIIRVGHLVCGFSVPTGTWDVLDLGVNSDNDFPYQDPMRPFDHTPTILVPRGDHLYHFNAATGRFQDIEANGPPAPAGKSS